MIMSNSSLQVYLTGIIKVRYVFVGIHPQSPHPVILLFGYSQILLLTPCVFFAMAIVAHMHDRASLASLQSTLLS